MGNTFAPVFPIIDDETTDISTGTIYEGPVGMIQVPTNDAETLTLAIKDILFLCMTPLSSCLAQHTMVHQVHVWLNGEVVLQHAKPIRSPSQ